MKNWTPQKGSKYYQKAETSFRRSGAKSHYFKISFCALCYILWSGQIRAENIRIMPAHQYFTVLNTLSNTDSQKQENHAGKLFKGRNDKAGKYWLPFQNWKGTSSKRGKLILLLILCILGVLLFEYLFVASLVLSVEYMGGGLEILFTLLAISALVLTVISVIGIFKTAKKIRRLKATEKSQG